ncbi:MAG: ATP-dependent helicase HrpB, partial [Parvularculaceae bacterium]|nr:ATP-dependent helicase HrpB [Parvularculaceae bacterium]
MTLPIDEKIADIRASLAAETRLVLAAPPGAGKTTRLPIALLDEPWLAGRRILLLEPRRIAARLAAERMAATLGERLGDTVGLATRIERQVSRATRIEVVTDGLAARRLVADPELSGVGAVLFDEFHERSLPLDLALALALESQIALRPDLRLIIMSATLDTARIATRIKAPVIASEGRQFPVETIYLGRGPEPLEERMARAVRRALREHQGSALAFLPGQKEILRTAEQLAGVDALVAPLYGALPPAEQDAATAPAPPGRRKVVLATDIAESSLTIPDVAIVVDSGLARIASFDPESGSRLSTERASRASVDQRRGRAGRTGPGVCYRLWDEAETRGLPAEPTPEILSADLSGLVLTLAEWGERDASRLAFVDPPPPGRLANAAALLRELGALDASGALTARGRDMARLPLDPSLAAM